jgi:hypothetical protein
MRTVCLLLMSLFTGGILSAQKKTMSAEELKKLGRDSLIKMAVHTVKDTAFHASYYQDVTVKANKEHVRVIFSNPVRLKMKKYCYYDAVEVDLSNGTVSRSLTGECDAPIIAFYKPTPEMNKKIAFVFDAINKSDEIGHVPDNKLPAGTIMDIIDNKNYYLVEVSDEDTFSTYKVDKTTGKISEANHKHYAKEGPPSEWEIIN